MTGQHTDHGPAADYQWRVSTWGPWSHAFREFGEVVSEAICSQCSLTSKLTENKHAVKCPGCLTVIGEGLADKLGDRHPLD